MTDEIRQRLICTVDRLYTEDRITTYYAGGAQRFDTLASEVVIERRAVLPNLRLVVVVPHAGQAASWSSDEKDRYERIKNGANDVICLAEHYYQGCMQRRNRYLVDHSDVCVCYLTGPTGGTAYTVEYARRQGLRVLNLAHDESGTLHLKDSSFASCQVSRNKSANKAIRVRWQKPWTR